MKATLGELRDSGSRMLKKSGDMKRDDCKWETIERVLAIRYCYVKWRVDKALRVKSLRIQTEQWLY